MPTIFDRCRIDAYRLPKVDNVHAHSADIASIAVRVAAATYAFTSGIDPASKRAMGGEREIPFRSLKRYLASGGGASDRDWYGPEGGRDSFVISVTGGAAYGVLLQDLIFVGFRGTTNVADWSINLFGLGRSGPLKCPLETEFYARKYHHFGAPVQNANSHVHAGFYRVSQALRPPLHDEINKLQQKYRERTSNNYPHVILRSTLNSARHHARNRQAITLEIGTRSRSKAAADYAVIRHVFRRLFGTYLSQVSAGVEILPRHSHRRQLLS